MISQAEENYLKAIFKISERESKAANTNAVAAELKTTAASVTDMLRKLAEKELIHYEKYRGVTLTTEGVREATFLIRKHRLWEVFLCERLGYTWDECHDLAEQLEHIQSDDLIDRLDEFLGKPKFDPHGDPIPDFEGNITERQQRLLSALVVGEKGIVVGVDEHSPAFLQHLNRIGVVLGVKIEVLEIFEFDGSVRLRLNNGGEIVVSDRVSNGIFLKI
ncbi:MAG: metal-dependent transcriptional regulator [Saprospiraceae bacterium]|nr:metal-dependent transcriptional regulator [Saprospiraceae bacterium]